MPADAMSEVVRSERDRGFAKLAKKVPKRRKPVPQRLKPD
jgi:hypothetical protein